MGWEIFPPQQLHTQLISSCGFGVIKLFSFECAYSIKILVYNRIALKNSFRGDAYMKKSVFIVLAIILISLSACGGGKEYKQPRGWVYTKLGETEYIVSHPEECVSQWYWNKAHLVCNDNLEIDVYYPKDRQEEYLNSDEDIIAYLRRVTGSYYEEDYDDDNILVVKSKLSHRIYLIESSYTDFTTIGGLVFLQDGQVVSVYSQPILNLPNSKSEITRADRALIIKILSSIRK